MRSTSLASVVCRTRQPSRRQPLLVDDDAADAADPEWILELQNFAERCAVPLKKLVAVKGLHRHGQSASGTLLDPPDLRRDHTFHQRVRFDEEEVVPVLIQRQDGVERQIAEGSDLEQERHGFPNSELGGTRRSANEESTMGGNRS